MISEKFGLKLGIAGLIGKVETSDAQPSSRDLGLVVSRNLELSTSARTFDVSTSQVNIPHLTLFVVNVYPLFLKRCI
jgi:hypothetical protein